MEHILYFKSTGYVCGWRFIATNRVTLKMVSHSCAAIVFMKVVPAARRLPPEVQHDEFWVAEQNLCVSTRPGKRLIYASASNQRRTPGDPCATLCTSKKKDLADLKDCDWSTCPVR